MTMTPPGPTSAGPTTTSPETTTDPASPADADADRAAAALLARLPVSAKIALLTGADSWRVPGSPEIGLRPIVTSDGPAGVRGITKDERTPSASLPCPSALGASWDPDLVRELHRPAA